MQCDGEESIDNTVDKILFDDVLAACGLWEERVSVLKKNKNADAAVKFFDIPTLNVIKSPRIMILPRNKPKLFKDRWFIHSINLYSIFLYTKLSNFQSLYNMNIFPIATGCLFDYCLNTGPEMCLPKV